METRRTRRRRTAAATRRIAPDVALLLVVPVVLLGVYALPRTVRRQFLFAYADPSPVTAVVAPFVHLRATHLATNLAGYLATAPTAYALATAAGHRRYVRRTFLAVTLALPPSLSYLNLAVPRPGATYGFSGVVMGYLGMLGIGLFVFVRHHVWPRLDTGDAPTVFFVGVAIVGWAVSRAAPRATPVAAVATVFALGYAVQAARRLDAWRDGWADPRNAALLAVAVSVFATLSVVAFPADPTVEGGVLNLYVHLLGFCLGFLTAFAGTIVPRSPIGPSRAGE